MRFIYTKTFRRAFIAIILIAMFIVGNATGVLSPITSVIQEGYGGISGFLSSGLNRTKDFLATIGALSRLAKENAELNQQINELSFDNSRLQSAKNENITLRRALNFKESTQYETIPAEITAQDPTGFSQTVIIDKGQSDGVILGQAVIVSPGILVGRVTKTFSGTSQVTLITDPSITMNGEVADSGARGLVKGEHGISLILDLVTQNEVIKAGDKIITSGLSGDFPRGLLIGEINAIKTSSSELFQQAFVTPATDLKNLSVVFVVK